MTLIKAITSHSSLWSAGVILHVFGFCQLRNILDDQSIFLWMPLSVLSSAELRLCNKFLLALTDLSSPGSISECSLPPGPGIIGCLVTTDQAWENWGRGPQLELRPSRKGEEKYFLNFDETTRNKINFLSLRDFGHQSGVAGSKENVYILHWSSCLYFNFKVISYICCNYCNV